MFCLTGGQVRSGSLFFFCFPSSQVRSGSLFFFVFPAARLEAVLCFFLFFWGFQIFLDFLFLFLLFGDLPLLGRGGTFLWCRKRPVRQHVSHINANDIRRIYPSHGSDQMLTMGRNRPHL
jgi:hypothetical protein